MTEEIPAYNKEGVIEYIVVLPEKVQHIAGRTSKGEHLYYKGVGCTYSGHSSLSHEGYINCGNSDVFYYGYSVKNAQWCGKFGIFQDSFQPYFSDYIGTCGPKELKIIFNSRKFNLSAVEVVDAIAHDSTQSQYYFALHYKHHRIKYVDNSRALLNLMSYMVSEGWNFPWDKSSINDIDNYGFVTDVADMFESHDVRHKYGTIYSILYSLFQINREGYTDILKLVNCSHGNLSDIPFVAFLFMHNLGEEVYIKKQVNTKNKLYTHLVGNILLRGRNCAGVEREDQADKVMLSYLDRFKEQLSEEELSILNVY